MKTNRSGQAAILAEKDYTKIIKHVNKEKYKLLIHIARYTGERWGAIVQLKIEDVYYNTSDGKYIPKKEVTFKARTRKADPNGKQQTRELPIHQTLKQVLAAYAPQIRDNGYLFPSPRKLFGNKSARVRVTIRTKCHVKVFTNTITRHSTS